MAEASQAERIEAQQAANDVAFFQRLMQPVVERKKEWKQCKAALSAKYDHMIAKAEETCKVLAGVQETFDIIEDVFKDEIGTGLCFFPLCRPATSSLMRFSHRNCSRLAAESKTSSTSTIYNFNPT